MPQLTSAQQIFLRIVQVDHVAMDVDGLSLAESLSELQALQARYQPSCAAFAPKDNIGANGVAENLQITTFLFPNTIEMLDTN